MARLSWMSDEELLERRKETKKDELSNDCKREIKQGFKFELNGSTHHISYDTEAQNNIQDVLRMFDNNMIDTYTLTVDNNENYARLELTKQDFYELHANSVKHRERNISKLRDILCMQVDNAESIDIVEEITWDEPVDEVEEMAIDVSKGLQDQIDDINTTFDTMLPEEEA